MTPSISADLPAGNIIVKNIDGKDITLDNDDRDTAYEWFYWKFKAVFPEAGVYRFRFARANKVGTCGPCVSRDRGATWEWLHPENTAHPHQEFTYNCEQPGEVWFCQAWPYLQTDWEKFAAEFKDNPHFSPSVLCHSLKKRAVEKAVVQEGTPARTVLLTARHHAQESMAGHALEGFLRAVLADDAFGKEFRQAMRVIAVPFVDKDGVEDGDQGKGRKPRDHGRGYLGDTPSIFPENAAICEIVDTEKPFFVLDMHCPWLRGGGTNEKPYLVQGDNPLCNLEIDRFSALLEQEAPAEAPYRASNNIPYGTSWNTSANGKPKAPGMATGKGLKRYCHPKPFVNFAETVEIPFANFGDKVVTRKEALAFGAALARAVLRYQKARVRIDAEAAAGKKQTARILFTGDIMCNPEQLAAAKRPGGDYDFTPIFRNVRELVKNADYAVGNLEMPFAGEQAGFSAKEYSFNTPDSFAAALKETGFDLVSTANNHCLDREYAGLERTLQVLDEAGIAHTGTARTPDERGKMLLKEINGIKVAFISYTYGTNAFANHYILPPERAYAVNLSMPQETLPGSVHLLDPMEKIAENMEKNGMQEKDSPQLQQLAADIAGAKKLADYVIVLMHSGGQYNPEPDPYTVFLVNKIRDYGADMIVGNHPHVLHRFEHVRGMPVFWSLGNFSFTPGSSPVNKEHPESVDNAVVEIVLEKTPGGTICAGGKLRIMRNIIEESGLSVVTPLAALAARTADAAKKAEYAAALRAAAAKFLRLPPDAPLEVQDSYPLPQGK